MAIGSSLPPVDTQPVEPPAPPSPPAVEAAPAADPVPAGDQTNLSGETSSAPESNTEQMGGFRDNFKTSVEAVASAGKTPEKKPAAAQNSLISSSAAETKTHRLDKPNQSQASPTSTSAVRSSRSGGKDDQAEQLLQGRQGPISTSSGVERDEQGQIRSIGHASGNLFQLGKLGPDGRVDQVSLGSGETLERQGDGWKVTSPDGQSGSWKGDFAVDPQGNVSLTEADGSSTRYAADGSTRKLNAEGQVSEEQKLQAFADGSVNLRDGNDRLLRSGDAHGGLRSLGYDEQGRVNSFDLKSKSETLGMRLQADGSWKDSQGQSLRGNLSVSDQGDITFRQEDGSSRSWQHNGTQIERRGERILSTTDAQGRRVGFEYNGDKLSKIITVQGERELKDAQVHNDGSISASQGEGRVLLQPDGSSIASDRKGTTASAYDPEGKLSQVRSGGRTTSLGYDQQGKLSRVDFQGRTWERGAERDGHSRWHSQDGHGFTGEIQADSSKIQFQSFDPARGTRSETQHSLSGQGGSQRSFDKNDKLSGETLFQADGGRRERIFDDQGKDTGRYLHTDKDGQLSLDGKTKLDPLSAELKTYSRTLDNHGQTRPPFNAEKSAESLYRSLAGADDERAIFNELAGRSPEELKQIQDHFQSRYQYSLRDDLKSDLSFSDETRALAYLDGNHAKGDAVGLRNQMGDIKEVENLLQRQRSPEDVKAIEAAYRQLYKSDYRQDFNRRWGGYDQEISANRALLQGDRTSAAAAKAGYSLRDRDAEGVFQALSGPDGEALSRESRLAIKEQFSAQTGGKNLALDIDRNLVGNQNRRALALQFGDNAGAQAAVSRTAMKGNESGGLYGLFEGWGTDEKALEGGFERRSGESQQDWQDRQQAVNSQYQQTYGGNRWQDAKAETSGTDLQRLQSIQANGQLSAAERLYTATVGMGTREVELEAVLSKASTQELQSMRQDYSRRFPGRTLDQDVLGDVSGRLHHDASQWLRGMPDRQQDPDGHFAEQMHRFNETHAYERQGWQNAVGTSVTDTFFADGARADQRHLELQGMYQQAKAEGFRGPLSEKFESELSRAQGDLNHYRDGKDQATEGAATVATTAAAIGVVVCTAGTATPLVVAGASIGVGAGTNLVTRASMGGKEYTLGAAAKDTTLGGLDGATTLILPGVGKAVSPLLKTAAGQTVEKLAVRALSNPVVQRTALGMADGTLSGGAMSVAYAAAEDRTWDDGVLQGVKNLGSAGVHGAGVGALTGGVTANVAPPLLEKGRQLLGKGVDEGSLRTLGSLRENLGDQGTLDILASRPNTVKEDLGQLQRNLDGLPAHQQQNVTKALQETPELGKNLMEQGNLQTAVDETIKSNPDTKVQTTMEREAELASLRKDLERQIKTTQALADKDNPVAKKLLDLARDADKQGNIGPVSFREAKVLYREEMRGNLKEVARGPKQTDGVELGGSGQTWDIKSPVSGPVKGGYTDADMVNLVEKKLQNNTHVIIDKDRLNSMDRLAVDRLIEEMGPQWAGKVRTYTTRSEQAGPVTRQLPPAEIPSLPKQLSSTEVLSPPEGVHLSKKVDPNLSFQDYQNRPANWAEKVFGRKLPAFVGTPETEANHALLRQQMEDSLQANWGNPLVPRPDYAFGVPTKDLIFAQGLSPTVNAATLAKYQASATDGQLLLHIPTPDGSKYLVIDGHHRTSAAMLRGETTIEPARVYRLDQLDDLRLAGYDRESLQRAAQNHTRHLWIIDR